MTAISINVLFPVTNSVVQSGSTGASLSDMVLSTNPIIPFNATQSVLTFTSLSQVGGVFGLSSYEYKYAKNYFQGYDNAISLPNRLNFARYVNSAISPYIRGGISINQLSILQTITSGSITFVFDTPVALTGIDLSGASSLSAVATIIQAAMVTAGDAAATCTWDSITESFTVSNGNVSGTGTIAYCASTPLSEAMLMTSADGAILSQGSPSLTFLENITNVLNITTNWINATNLFDTTGSSQTPPYNIELQACSWVSSNNHNYTYTIWSHESTILTTFNSGIILALVNGGYASASSTQVTYNTDIEVIYGIDYDVAIQTVAFVGGIGNSVNYDNINSTVSYAGRSQSGLIPSITDTDSYNMMLQNGVNGYCSFSDDPSTFSEFLNGSIGGIYLWRDNVYNNKWLYRSLQSTVASLVRNIGKLPNNSNGYQILSGVLDEVMQQAVKNGTAQSGNKFDATQIAIITSQAGANITPALTNAGYFIQIIPATPSQRMNRIPPDVNIWYSNGGSFYSLPMNLIYVF